MSKVAVVYWSMTGNTEAMAKELASAADTEAIESSEFSADMCDQYDAFAFGCPAMGAEELEDSVFEPFISEIESGLSGKKVVLFGSYDWGDGEWMRIWQERMEKAGAVIVTGAGIIANNAPDSDAEASLKAAGAELAKL